MEFPADILLAEDGTPKAGVLDLGHDHYAEGYPRYGDDSGTVIGFDVLHRKGPKPIPAYAGSEWCMGGITLDVPEAAGLAGARWTLVAYDPLTVAPSFLCDCGDHGFIRDGKWVPA